MKFFDQVEKNDDGNKGMGPSKPEALRLNSCDIGGNFWHHKQIVRIPMKPCSHIMVALHGLINSSLVGVSIHLSVLKQISYKIENSK